MTLTDQQMKQFTLALRMCQDLPHKQQTQGLTKQEEIELKKFRQKKRYYGKKMQRNE